MKYDVRLFDDRGECKDVKRALRQCRVKFTSKAVERWDCCGRMPEYEGEEVRFTTKNRKVLKFIGLTDKDIAEFAVYKKRIEPRYKVYFREAHCGDLPF